MVYLLLAAALVGVTGFGSRSPSSLGLGLISNLEFSEDFENAPSLQTLYSCADARVRKVSDRHIFLQLHCLARLQYTPNRGLFHVRRDRRSWSRCGSGGNSYFV